MCIISNNTTADNAIFVYLHETGKFGKTGQYILNYIYKKDKKHKRTLNTVSLNK